LDKVQDYSAKGYWFKTQFGNLQNKICITGNLKIIGQTMKIEE
jgi:hypothetical protein